jgi:hypothetical protein
MTIRNGTHWLHACPEVVVYPNRVVLSISGQRLIKGLIEGYLFSVEIRRIITE